MANGEQDQKKSRRQRSPQYPSVSLETALDRARTLLDQEGLVEIPVQVAIEGWGYSAKSSSGIRLVAALNHYGLLDEEGSGDGRRISLSRLARRILLDERDNSGERKEAVRKAALKPQVFSELYRHFNGEFPSDANLRFHLIDELEFNPKKVDTLIEDYRETIEYADLDGVYYGLDIEDDSKEDSEGDADNGDSDDPTDPLAGRDTPEMPLVERQNALEPWDWTIPLLGGKQAILRVPRPLSDEDFKHLESMLTEFFPKQQRMLTSPPSVKDPSGGGDEG